MNASDKHERDIKGAHNSMMNNKMIRDIIGVVLNRTYEHELEQYKNNYDIPLCVRSQLEDNIQARCGTEIEDIIKRYENEKW